MDRRRKTGHTVIYTGLLIALIILLGGGHVISFKSIEHNTEQHVINDVRDCAPEQAEDISGRLSLVFDLMESFANYLGSRESWELSELKDPMTAILTENRFCTVGYTDRAGEILGEVSRNGESSGGNISDRVYFQKAIHWKDNRIVQYMTETDRPDDDRAVFAVPIVCNNKITGCLFAGTDQNFFEEKIFGESNYNKTDTFLIDPGGLIIAGATDKGVFQSGNNLFGSYLSEAEAETIRENISASESGAIIKSGKNHEYLSYANVEASDWTVVCVIDRYSADARFAKNMKEMRIIFLVTGIGSCVCFAGLAGFLLQISSVKCRTVERLECMSRNINGFLEKSGNAVFSYDSKNVCLNSSQALEEMIGYEIPRNWVSIIPERKKLHPEFDYEGIVRVYNEMIVTEEYRELCSALRINDNKTIWLKFSMTPAFDNAGNNSGIVGTVTDITEAHTAEKIGREEQSRILGAILSFIPLSFAVDMTKNTYSLLNCSSAYFGRLAATGMYSELAAYASMFVPESYRVYFLQNFDLENLIAEYENGEESLEYEHPFIVGPENEEKWVISKILFLQNEMNEDRRMLVMVIDNTIQKKHELLLNDARKNQCCGAGSYEHDRKTEVFIHTFGYFDVYVNGRPISFTHDKSKEMLAVLVDRRGGFVSSSEMIAYLWENESFNKTTQARCRQVASRLKKTLEKYGIGDIIETVNGRRRIIPEKVECDYFKYLDNKPEHRHLFIGTYMMNYSWSEWTAADLKNSRYVL